jgi:hypothetical protein
MLPVLGLVARLAIGAGFVFLLSKTLPNMPSMLWRFVFLFVLGVPLNFVINYADVRLLGYHRMGWGAALTISLLVAVWGTFLPPQPQNSNTP